SEESAAHHCEPPQSGHGTIGGLQPNTIPTGSGEDWIWSHQLPTTVIVEVSPGANCQPLTPATSYGISVAPNVTFTNCMSGGRCPRLKTQLAIWPVIAFNVIASSSGESAGKYLVSSGLVTGRACPPAIAIASRLVLESWPVPTPMTNVEMPASCAA